MTTTVQKEYEYFINDTRYIAYKLSEGYPISFDLINNIEYKIVKMAFSDDMNWQTVTKEVIIANCHYLNLENGIYCNSIIIDEEERRYIEKLKKVDALLKS